MSDIHSRPINRTFSLTSTTLFPTAESQNENKVNLWLTSKRLIWAFKLESSWISIYWNVVDAILNLLFCISYINNTQYERNPIPLNNARFELVVALLLVILWIPRWYLLEYRPNFCKSFFTSWSTYLTLAMILPICGDYQLRAPIHFNYFCFLLPLRFIRCYLSVRKCLVVSRKSFFGLSSKASKLAILAVTVLFILLTSTSCIHMVELKYEDRTPLTFFDAFFFSTLILTTVSYVSDLVPPHVFPRVVILIIFFFGLMFVPYALSELTTMFKSKSKYDHRYRPNPGERHVLLIASTMDSSSGVRHFLDEFFCQDHGPYIVNAKVVILHPREPPEMVSLLINDPTYKNSVQYVRGSALSLHSLRKAVAGQADACFILAQKFTESSHNMDAENVLRAMSVKKMNPAIKLYAQVLLPENKGHFEPFCEQVVCVDELKLGILAYSCLTPGFSTLIHILTTSSLRDESLAILSDPTYTQNILDPEYLHEYAEGCKKEIYLGSLSPFFSRKSFLECAAIVYDRFNVILFGLGIQTKSLIHNIRISKKISHNNPLHKPDLPNDYCLFLNPENYVLLGDEIAFLIAPDIDVIEKLAVYNEPNGDDSFFVNVGQKSSYSPQPHIRKGERRPLLYSQKILQEPSVKDGVPSRRNSSDSITSLSRRATGNNSLSESRSSMNLNNQNNSGVPPVPGNPALSRSAVSITRPRPVINIITDPQLFPDLSHHVVICDTSSSFPRNIDCFIRVLRARYLESVIPIIILTNGRPNDYQLRQLSEYDGIYFVFGNPLMREDLEKARIQVCSRVVILANSPYQKHVEKVDDGSAILIYLNVKAMTPPECVVIVEVMHIQTMTFMGDTEFMVDTNKIHAQFSPAFMSGSCYSVTFLDSLVCQAFFNPHLQKILEQLLFDSPLPGSISDLCADNEQSLPNSCIPPSSHLYTVPLPNTLNETTFHDVFYHFLQHHRAIALGLYRKRDVVTKRGKITSVWYVLPSPVSTLKVKQSDLVYLFSRPCNHPFTPLTSAGNY